MYTGTEIAELAIDEALEAAETWKKMSSGWEDLYFVAKRNEGMLEASLNLARCEIEKLRAEVARLREAAGK